VWIKQRDEAERQLWIEQHRTTDHTLGRIIKEVYAKQQAVWEVSREITEQLNQSAVKAGSPAVVTVVPKGAPPAPSAAAASSGLSLAATLRNGQAICAAFNSSKGCKTKGASCSQGLHCCSITFKSGRVCGMSNHTALKCKKQKKSQ
jgi:hypothetical protein